MQSCCVLASHNTAPAAPASLRSEKLREGSSFIEEMELITEILNTEKKKSEIREHEYENSKTSSAEDRGRVPVKLMLLEGKKKLRR